MTHEHDREVIVTDRGGSGGGTGVILGVIVVIALVFVLWFLAIGPGRGAFGGSLSLPDVNVDVNVTSLAAPSY